MVQSNKIKFLNYLIFIYLKNIMKKENTDKI